MGNLFSSLPVECILTRSWDICCGDERAKYVRDLRKNVKSLEKLLPDLSARKEDILSKVEAAEEYQELRRLQVVDLWLTTVATEEIEAGKLIQESRQEMKNLCFGGCCSKNCISSYKFGKKVVQELNTVHDLLARTEKEDFKPLFGPPQPNQVELISMKPPVGLDSTFDKTWSFIQNEEVEIIGVYGPGGVGKTTLLQQINNKFSNTNFFVIWAVVSKGCNPEKLQEDIGKRINLSNDDSWKMKSYDEKARDIFRTLVGKKFALLLDDIWEHVDLTEMGIPSPIKSNGSKIIFTTRSFQLCSQMLADHKVMVECLAPAEAFKLFCDNVGRDTLASHSNIPKLAKIVAKECAGLPLAIITVARAMTGKRTSEEWGLAIEDLQRCAAKFEDMAENVLSILKFSYDYLRDEKVKSCFLYCCLFREDSIISKSKLIEFWSFEGFLGKGSVIRNHNRGVGIIETLLKACLLEEHDTASVTMHDVTREMALWIAQDLEKEKYGFFVMAGFNLSSVPGVEEWEKTKKVSLMDNNIEELQEVPSCSHLVTLFLNNNKLEKINGQFFQSMRSLTVLDLSHNGKLRKLPSEISALVSLEYLNLSYTNIQKLPIELSALIRLKYFNLEYCRRLEQIPCKLISNFQELQQFKMIQEGKSLISEGSAKLFFGELRSLKHLDTLTITISSFAEFNEFQKSKKLQSCTSELIVRNTKVSVSILTNMELEHLESLEMYKCEIVEELDRERVKRGYAREMKLQTSTNIAHSMIFGKRFDRLHTVKIDRCTGVVDLTWLIVAPNLTSIKVILCWEIEEIINVEKLSENENLNLFAKLENMELLGLAKLQSIYKYALPFSHLKQLNIVGCENLRKLPINSSTSKDIKFVVYEPEREWWEQELEWEDEATRMAFSNRAEYREYWLIN